MASYVQLGQNGKVLRDPPKKSPKKRGGSPFAYVAIILVLVLGIGAMAGTMLWMQQAGAPNQSTSGNTTIDVRYTGTRTSTTLLTVPSTTTTSQMQTTTTTIPYVKGPSGSFAGNGDKVKLLVEYGTVKQPDGSEAMQMRVYLQSFSLTLGKRSGSITINGKTTKFTSDEITIEDNVRTKTLLTTQVLDTAEQTLNVEIVWDFDITYSGVEIDDLTATGVITLG